MQGVVVGIGGGGDHSHWSLCPAVIDILVGETHSTERTMMGAGMPGRDK